MKLLERIGEVGKRRHLLKSTVECYQRWVEEFLRFCACQPPAIEAAFDLFDIPLLEEDSLLARRRVRQREFHTR